MTSVTRSEYAASFGPTVGDRIRLADTNLVIEIEQDFTVGGDEAVFGGGKTIRESMAQSAYTRAEGALDLVITGATILDHWGVVKADVGVRDGRIVALGHAGNPDTTDGIHRELVIGPSTEVIAGNGKILTAGTIDSHVHFIYPDQIAMALQGGVTTLIGGGTGAAEGSRATTVTPGAWWIHRILESMEPWPVNVLLLGKGNTTNTDALREQLVAGAGGLKCHEDWGATPAILDAALRVADDTGVQVAVHSDTLNEAGFVEDMMTAVAGRTFHAYHTEGAGGGHAPDIISIASHPNVLPASTNPTRPYTVNTIAEHLDMVMVCHHLNPKVPNDIAFAESRVRAGTIAAEDVLQDLGALSIMSSDASAMGRISEVSMRSWQTAHQMKALRGCLSGDSRNDNLRARRYVAKYTINPAIAHGINDHVGSVEVGKLADLVLWDPAMFSVRPHMVLKGGMVAVANLGDPNAAIPSTQPLLPRPGFNYASGSTGPTTLAFVSQQAMDDGLPDKLRLRRGFAPVASTRALRKADMRENGATPDIQVDPDTYAVRVDGELIEHEPATKLPMTQRYFLF